MKISLDCAQLAFIASDKLVLSLRGGELYVLTLCADSLRCVRSFHFSKAAASVLTCCVSYKHQKRNLFTAKNLHSFIPANYMQRRIPVSWISARKFTSRSIF